MRRRARSFGWRRATAPTPTACMADVRGRAGGAAISSSACTNRMCCVFGFVLGWLALQSAAWLSQPGKAAPVTVHHASVAQKQIRVRQTDSSLGREQPSKLIGRSGVFIPPPPLQSPPPVLSPPPPPPAQVRTNASIWSPRAGVCAVTSSGEGVHCAEGELKGTWTVRSLRECREACFACPRCRWFSHSPGDSDCSWYHSCPRLLHFGTQQQNESAKKPIYSWIY